MSVPSPYGAVGFWGSASDRGSMCAELESSRMSDLLKVPRQALGYGHMDDPLPWEQLLEKDPAQL